MKTQRSTSFSLQGLFLLLLYILSNMTQAKGAKEKKLRKSSPTLFQCDQFGCHLPDPNIINFPWENESQYEKVVAAYKAFERNIAEFRFIANIPNKEKTPEERARLNKYNRAIASYKPMILGKGKVTFFGSKNSKNKGNKRLLRNAFFKDWDDRKYIFLRFADYAKKPKDIFLIEEISEFDRLSAPIKNTFGKQLCEEMDRIHELKKGTYCSQPKVGK